MRLLLASCATLLLAACARPAAAQVAGQFGGATPIAVDSHVFGGYVGLAQHQYQVQTQLRLSFYPGIDFGFQGGMHHFAETGSERNAIELGGDVRTLVARRGKSSLFDVSLGGAIAVSSADHYNVLSVGPTMGLSRTIKLSAGAEFVPYGGAALFYSRSDIGSENTTDISLPLRFGMEYRPNAGVRTELEFQVPLSDATGTHPKIMLGANFPF